MCGDLGYSFVSMTPATGRTPGERTNSEHTCTRTDKESSISLSN